MFCRIHNVVFLAENGCNKCQTSWEDGPWETKEKEWINKLDEIAEKAQKLANYASGLEVDNKGLKRALNTMTLNWSKERRDLEVIEATVSRLETKLQAIGIGYRKALEREGDLQLQIQVVIKERGEWIERCRLAENLTSCSRCGNVVCNCSETC